MAKKGQAIQLQAELFTDEEWDAFLLKPGLLLIDVFSDWCGPCASMQAHLKKLKIEIGGDTLQLAVAKCDTVTVLERFRGKSEPTWMFISQGKMVNFMYGADAPKLVQLIIDELKRQRDVDEGLYVREDVLEVTDRAPEDLERYEIEKSVIEADEAIEQAKKEEEKKKRLLAESDSILENVGNLTICVVFPHARDKYMEVLKDVLVDAGIVIAYSDKTVVTPEQVEELMYFAEEDMKFPKRSLDNLYNGGFSQIICMKPSHGTQDHFDTMVGRALELVYGPPREPPGEEECVYQKLLHFPTEQEQTEEIEEQAESQPEAPTESQSEEPTEEEDEDGGIIIGIWPVPNKRVFSSAMKVFFPRISSSYVIPEPGPPPTYVTVAFDISRRDTATRLMSEYHSQILHYGLFTSEYPEDASLLAKTFKQYDKKDIPKSENDRVVIQLSKKSSECVFNFALEMPLYMSANAKEGKRECKIFFPEDYGEMGDLDELDQLEPKHGKKSKADESRGPGEENVAEDAEPDTTSEVLTESGFEGVQIIPTESAAVEPAAIEPAAIEPAAVEPAAIEPAPVEPAAVEPAAVEPAAIEPAAIEPAAIEPAAIEPAAIKSALIEPGTVEPAAIEPPAEGTTGGETTGGDTTAGETTTAETTGGETTDAETTGGETTGGDTTGGETTGDETAATDTEG